MRLTAHWNAHGICGREGDSDRIRDGAVDNLGGTAPLVAVARRVVALGPRSRDVVFAATTAEEQGLVGDHALRRLHIAAPDRIAAVLDLDTVAVAGLEAAVVTIGGSCALAGPVRRVAERQGRRFDDDGEADGFLRRRDGWVFGRIGVPAALISGGFSDMDRRASDEVARADLSGTAADVRLWVELVRRLADPPLWTIQPLAPPPPSP